MTSQNLMLHFFGGVAIGGLVLTLAEKIFGVAALFGVGTVLYLILVSWFKE